MSERLQAHAHRTFTHFEEREREVGSLFFIHWVLVPPHTPTPNTLLFIDGGSCHSQAMTKG